MNVSQPTSLTNPNFDRLAMIERARQQVIHGDGEGPATVHPWLERSWRRCLDSGMTPGQRVTFDPVSAAATQRAIDANQTLLRAAAPVIRSLARAMADTRYFAILTDAQGVVIDVNGPINRQEPQAAAIARVGVDLSESAVGTTAIGATLAEGAPVWLHRGEHFFNDTSIYSCAGAPLFGPQGQCVGMLDLTGINVPERPALRHLVTQSARSIENALTLAMHHELLLRLNWPGHVLGEEHDGLVCVDGDGYITAANRAASDMLNLAPGGVWPHCNDVFAIPLGTLFDAARQERGPTEQPLWCGLRLQVLVQAGGHSPGNHPLQHAGHRVPLRQVESALIRKAVEDAQGNVAEAARALGISRATVYRKLERK
jgi:sigma-54 dependent transcriptional regulator, acetoin dehydrogenase operon transcriptional activator AcoR